MYLRGLALSFWSPLGTSTWAEGDRDAKAVANAGLDLGEGDGQICREVGRSAVIRHSQDEIQGGCRVTSVGPGYPTGRSRRNHSGNRCMLPGRGPYSGEPK